MGDKARQGETRGDKTSGRQTHHPTQAHMWGDKWRQGETRPREGEHRIQHRHTCGETMGDKWRQGETGGDKTPGRRTHHPTQAHMWGDYGRQGLGKADTESNTHTCGETMGDHGRQGETRPREGGHTIQHQGGHLKKALRTPNSTLFGGKCYAKVSPKLEIAPPVDQTAVSTSTLGFHVAFCEGKSTAAHWAKVP